LSRSARKHSLFAIKQNSSELSLTDRQAHSNQFGLLAWTMSDHTQTASFDLNSSAAKLLTGGRG
jgi:hypothetical protein